MLNIQNGVLQGDQLAGIPLERHIISKSGQVANVRTGLAMEGPYGVTLHNTGNNNLTADARNHAAWLAQVEKEDQLYVGAHFFTDAHRIVQTLPINEVAWHAGDGAKGQGNRRTIAIEICETRPYAQGEAHALRLAAELLKAFPQAKLFKHQDFTGKYCPRVILSEGRWESVKERVENMLREKPTEIAKPSKAASPWAREACQWAVDEGLFIGDESKDFHWHDPVSRQELALVLQRLVGI